MFLSVQVNHRDSCTNHEWPEAEGLKFQACCGVIGPEVEANWITKILDSYGIFERLISRNTKSQAVDWLVKHGYPEKSARIWADRYYL